MSSEVLVRYDIKKFMGYKGVNDILPAELEKHCLTNNNNALLIREEFENDLSNIVTSVLNGINPNDILLKTTIRDILNKISSNNYDECLNNLKNIKYANKNHFIILAQDIIDRSMNDPVACKGFTPSDSDVYISDVNANISREFCQFSIEGEEDGEKKIKFKDVLTSLCQKQFLDFMNKSKKLDANNKHRIDNYKGFMNFLGLLFNRNILSRKIIVVCLFGIKELIFESDWDKSESENVFTGYERLVSQLIFNLDKTKCENAELLSALITITKSIKDSNEKNQKLRRIPMLTHESIMRRLTELKEKYSS